MRSHHDISSCLGSPSPHGSCTIRGALAHRPSLHVGILRLLLLRLLQSGRASPLLRDDLARVELHQHGPVSLDLLDGDRQAEIVQQEELQLEVVQLGEGQAADLFHKNTLGFGFLAFSFFVGRSLDERTQGGGRLTLAYREFV